MAREALSVRRPRSQWKRLVAKHRGSGLDDREFCRQEQLNVATLRWWRSQLGRESACSSGQAGAQPAFAPVTVRPATDVEPGVVEVLLQRDERRLRIRGDCPVDLAVAITQALLGAGSCS